MIRAAVQFILITFGMNAVWEVLQTPLYYEAHMFGVVAPSSLLNLGYDGILLYATLGDVFYLGLIYAIVACIERRMVWITNWHIRDTAMVLALGFALASMIEWRGLGQGHWIYSALMPIVPAIHVGLSPFLQLSTTALISFYLLKKFR